MGGKPLGGETPPILFPTPIPAPVDPPIADRSGDADKIDRDDSATIADKSNKSSVTSADAFPDSILLTDIDISKANSIAYPDTNNSNTPHNLRAPTNLDKVSNEYFVSYLFPTDWVDYTGLGYEVAERMYIEFNYKEVEEKTFSVSIRSILSLMQS